MQRQNVRINPRTPSRIRGRRMPSSKDAIVATLVKSFAEAKKGEQPYPHWFVNDCLPADVVADVLALPFPAPALGGVSGKREVHNATRKYFDAENMEKYPVCNAVNAALQDRRVNRGHRKSILDKTRRHLSSRRIRAGHQRLLVGAAYRSRRQGLHLFSCTRPTDAQHSILGTDIYDAEKKHVGRSPFKSNSAMIFVPSNNTLSRLRAPPDRWRAQNRW